MSHLFDMENLAMFLLFFSWLAWLFKDCYIARIKAKYKDQGGDEK